MSTEVRWLIRDGDGGGKGEKEWRLDCMLQPGRLRRLWTTARTTKMLRLCPFAIAYRTIAVSTSVQSSHKQYCWVTTEAKEVQLSEPSSTSLLLISPGFSPWGSSTTSLLLISPGPATERKSNLFGESPAHLPPLDLAWTRKRKYNLHTVAYNDVMHR